MVEIWSGMGFTISSYGTKLVGFACVSFNLLNSRTWPPVVDLTLKDRPHHEALADGIYSLICELRFTAFYEVNMCF